MQILQLQWTHQNPWDFFSSRYVTHSFSTSQTNFGQNRWECWLKLFCFIFWYFRKMDSLICQNVPWVQRFPHFQKSTYNLDQMEILMKTPNLTLIGYHLLLHQSYMLILCDNAIFIDDKDSNVTKESVYCWYINSQTIST